MAVQSGNGCERAGHGTINTGARGEVLNQAGAEGSRYRRAAGSGGPLWSTSHIKHNGVTQLDAQAKADTVAIAFGPVEQCSRLRVTPQIDALRHHARVFQLASDAIGMSPGFQKGGITLDAGISMERGQGDPVAAALQPAQTEPVLPESSVGGAQQNRV